MDRFKSTYQGSLTLQSFSRKSHISNDANCRRKLHIDWTLPSLDDPNYLDCGQKNSDGYMQNFGPFQYWGRGNGRNRNSLKHITNCIAREYGSLCDLNLLGIKAVPSPAHLYSCYRMGRAKFYCQQYQASLDRVQSAMKSV